MARLSTGQAFGEVSRTSAARLLGGIPTDASGEALAQGSINAPSLQPRATPVDTFQRVGAPTLGGAPKFFAPPDLPNPGQDLANLSRALGGFSSTLQSFGETWLANKKEEDKRQEAATGALVGQASRFGPAREIADLAANLEKAAALGTPGAAQMLQDVRAKQNSSVGKYWLERSIEQNAIQNAALSLPDLVANTSVIKGADGKNIDIKTLSPEDPEYLAYESDVLFGGMLMSPQGYAKNQGIIIQAQLQARQVQRKRYNANQSARLTEQITYNQQSSAQEYVANTFKGIPPESAQQLATSKIQSDIEAINYLPLTEEQKADLRDKYPERWLTQALAAVKQRGGSISVNVLLKPLGGVMTGPIDQRVKADGTPNESLRLVNTLGGPALYDQLAAKANASLIQDNTQKAQMAGIQEQQDYDLRRAAAKKDGTLDDPAASTAWYEREEAAAALIPDYQVRNARMSAIEADRQNNDARVVKPVQDAKALYYAQQLTGTYNDESKRNRLAAELQADLNANRVSNATAVRIQETLSAQGSKEVRTYDKDINKRIDDKTKLWEAYIGSPGSYGESTVTSFESQALYKFRDEARRKSHDVVYQAIKDGKDPTEALNKLWTNSNFGLRKREDVGGVQPPRYDDTTELIKKNTGNWARSTIAPREANELRSQAKVRPLMKLEAWDRDVTSLLNGNPSQNFKTLLKTLTTGTGGQKPSDVILNQFKLLGIEVPENERQKFRALDGQEISRATPARRTTPQQNGALAGFQIVGGALGNLLVPPAQARPNGNLGSQLAAQLEARGGYEDTAGPAVQRRPWAGEAGQFAPKGSFQNGLDAINKAGASIAGFLAGKPNDIKLVTQFYSKNPEVANQYDLPVNLFVRYISGLGAKGLQVSQAQGQRVLSQIEAAKQDVPRMVAWVEQNMSSAYAADYKRTIAKGKIPVSGSIPKRDAEIDNSLGRFWATPQKDGSYLITEDFDFGYAPKAQGGNDKRAAMTRRMSVIPSPDPVSQARRLVTGGFGKPFRYTLRVSPDGRVQVNP